MEIIISLIYLFRQVFGPNLDILYFISLIFLIKDILFARGILLIKAIKIFFPILLFALLQFIFLKNVDLFRTLINISKIFINIFLFLYCITFLKIDYFKIVKWTSHFFIVSIPFAFIFKNSFLWRHGDIINKFSETRLQLFYSEPSELSFYVSIVILFIIYYLTLNRKNKFTLNFKIYLCGLLYILYLSKGFGGIVCLLISIGILYLLNVFEKNSLKKIITLMLITLSVLLFASIVFRTNNELINRFYAIYEGYDSSTNYRYFTGIKVMIAALQSTKGVGVGFGNLNTEYALSQLSYFGLLTRIANSFMYFIAEGGYFACFYLLYLFSYIIKKLSNNKNDYKIKISLLFFVFLYQIGGGYFTNPINWIIYGIISSNYNIFKNDSFEV
jgi:hypothetical protein